MNLEPFSLDILVIAPHPDDAELGAAGAILKFKAEGLKVGILDLTSGEPTPYGSLEKRAAETAAATKILGLDWRQNLGLPNRSLEATLEARRELAIVFRHTRPRWLFAPYWGDAHPDHIAATQLSMRLASGRSSRRPTCPASRGIRPASSITTAST